MKKQDVTVRFNGRDINVIDYDASKAGAYVVTIENLQVSFIVVARKRFDVVFYVARKFGNVTTWNNVIIERQCGDVARVLRERRLCVYYAEHVKQSQVWRAMICDAHTGKMRGMWSASTSVQDNTRCQCRAACAATICAKCYSIAMNDNYDDLAVKLRRNSILLCNADFYDFHSLARRRNDTRDAFRFESFGDLNNARQLANYARAAAFNSDVIHTLWTKNLDIVIDVFCDFEKPSNMIIGYSIPLENCSMETIKQVCKAISLHPVLKRCISFVFVVGTVYGDLVNCGGRACAPCRRCYTAGVPSEISFYGVSVVFEQTK